MLTAPSRIPTAAVDLETGRLRSQCEVESRVRTADLARDLDDLERIGDETDTDEPWAELCRNMDEGRPHRPPFQETCWAVDRVIVLDASPTVPVSPGRDRCSMARPSAAGAPRATFSSLHFSSAPGLNSYRR
jgi:hypothetical protein